MMNRRAFLATASVLPFATAPRTAFAIEPMTVLTVVQMGLTAASLFGPRGPDLGDLIRAQTELLLAVSQKIDTIMAAIKVLDGRLQDLTKLVGNLPNETVKVLKVTESLVRNIRRDYRAYGS